MAPVLKSIKVTEEIIIEDFLEKYNTVLFFGTDGTIEKTTRFALLKKNATMEIRIGLSNGLSIELRKQSTITNDVREAHQVRLSGRIEFVEAGSSATIEATDFCSQWGQNCRCGEQPYNCALGGFLGHKKVAHIKLGDHIPEKATFRLTLEFWPMGTYSSRKRKAPADMHNRKMSGHQALERDMATLRNNIETADVNIICDGRSFPAHKLILSARSDVFAALFSHTGTREHESGEVKISDCTRETMESFLSYIYEGNFSNATFEKAEALIHIAKLYNVRSLVESCLQILEENINEQNAFHVANLAELYSEASLKKAALAKIGASLGHNKYLKTSVESSRIIITSLPFSAQEELTIQKASNPKMQLAQDQELTIQKVSNPKMQLG